jgi:transcriptional regulator with XRE-family HTH domain
MGKVNSEFMSSAPYRILGLQLRKFREQLKESVAEVSGAIEIDESKLALIEQGKIRPAEDILLLLISHFSMQDEEALKVWNLAGYDQDDMSNKASEEAGFGKQLLMVMTLDPRIMYSDNIQVVANSNGVIINFMQSPGGPYPPQTISRIGMSREQAHKALEVINEALYQSDKYIAKKQLPIKGTKTNKDSNSKDQKN